MELVAWSAVVGALLPLVISFVKGANMAKGAKQFIALGVSVVAAVITTGANELWQFVTWQEFFNQLLSSFTVIFALAQTTYTGFWEDRAPEVWLAKFGSNT